MEFMHIRFIDKKKNCDKDFFLKEGPCQLKMAVTGRKMTWQKMNIWQNIADCLRQGHQLIQEINWTDDL